jgi:hypothetical protein
LDKFSPLEDNDLLVIIYDETQTTPSFVRVMAEKAYEHRCGAPRALKSLTDAELSNFSKDQLRHIAFDFLYFTETRQRAAALYQTAPIVQEEPVKRLKNDQAQPLAPVQPQPLAPVQVAAPVQVVAPVQPLAPVDQPLNLPPEMAADLFDKVRLLVNGKFTEHRQQQLAALEREMAQRRAAIEQAPPPSRADIQAVMSASYPQ